MYFNKKLLFIFFIATLLLRNIHALSQREIEDIFASNNYEIIHQFMESQESNSSAFLHQRYAQFLLQKSLTEQAIIHLHLAQKLDDAEQFQIDYWLSQAYALLGDYASALQYAAVHYEKNSYLEQALIEYIWLLYKNLKEDEALHIALENLPNFPRSFTLQSLIAMVYGEKGDHEQAIYYYDASERLAEELNLDRQYLLSNYYNQFILEKEWRNFKKAKEILTKAYAIDEENPLILRLLGDFYHQQMNLEQSKYYYDLSELAEITQVSNKRSLRTPLGKLSLIDLYLDFLELTEALIILEQINREKDKFAWMKIYGLNPTFFDSMWREKEIRYWQLFLSEREFKLTRSWRDMFQNIRIFFKIRRLNLAQQRSYLNSINYANDLQHLENRILYSLSASNSYPLLQRNMLHHAQDIFKSPRNKQQLLFQEAKLKKNSVILKKLLDDLLLPYENHMKMQILLALLEQRDISEEERISYLSDLFLINAPFTQQFSMPMQLYITASTPQRIKNIENYLKRISIHQASTSPYILYISEDNQDLDIKLYLNNTVLKKFTLPFQPKAWRTTFEEMRIKIFYDR